MPLTKFELAQHGTQQKIAESLEKIAKRLKAPDKLDEKVEFLKERMEVLEQLAVRVAKLEQRLDGLASATGKALNEERPTAFRGLHYSSWQTLLEHCEGFKARLDDLAQPLREPELLREVVNDLVAMFIEVLKAEDITV